jgi:four helix bundle protein
MKGDDIFERLLNLGVRIVRMIEVLPKTLSGKHIGLQLLRSGTSAGANYEEARGAESKADFVHKLGVSWKETREARYWLCLIHRSELIKPKLVESLLQEVEEISRILARSIATAKKSNSNREL